MVVIAELFCHPLRSVPHGDADRDGRREFYGQICLAPDIWAVCAVEHQGNNQFDTTEISLPEETRPEGIGDADRDGLFELYVYKPGLPSQLYVFESPDSSSLPTDSVWACGVGGEVTALLPQVADLDGDSAREIAVAQGAGVPLYECISDNRYDLRYVLPDFGSGEPTMAQCNDMNRNGRPEMAVACRGGLVAFYEAAGDGSAILLDTVRLFRGVGNTIPLALAPTQDLDGDGRTEVLSSYYDWNQNRSVLAALESPGDDSFAAVWAETTSGGSLRGSIAVGDIDGDSVFEFVVVDYSSIRLYRCTGDDQYECFWQTDTRSVCAFATLYDVNSDGQDELIYDYRDSVLIREWLPVGVEERVAEALKRITVAPSVVRGSEVVHVAGLPPSAACEVVDASGRVVATLASGVWHPASVVAGTYFIRIRVGNQATVRKVLVVE
jgi:hypothetical protein